MVFVSMIDEIEVRPTVKPAKMRGQSPILGTEKSLISYLNITFSGKKSKMILT